MLVNNKSPMSIGSSIHFLRPENHDYYNIFEGRRQFLKNLPYVQSD